MRRGGRADQVHAAWSPPDGSAACDTTRRRTWPGIVPAASLPAVGRGSVSHRTPAGPSRWGIDSWDWRTDATPVSIWTIDEFIISCT